MKIVKDIHELKYEANQGIADIYQALLLGIRDYFGKMVFFQIWNQPRR
jgi:hypothetical protein